MGWSDSVDERFGELERKVGQLAAFAAQTLVGRRVRLGSDYRKEYKNWPSFTYRQYEREDGVVESVDGNNGDIVVATDAGEKRSDSFFNIEEILS